MITLPEFVLSYRDPANKAAVDRALASKRTPGVLTVDQAREFYRAKSLGEIARLEFWCFLHDLWRETWGKFIGDLKPIPLGDRIWEGGEYRPADTWQEGRMISAHRLGNGSALFSGIKLKDDTGLRLMVSVWRSAGFKFANDTADYKLNGGWKLEAVPDAGPAYWTPSGLVMVKDTAPVVVDKLLKYAEAAVKLVIAKSSEAAPGKSATPARPAKLAVVKATTTRATRPTKAKPGKPEPKAKN